MKKIKKTLFILLGVLGLAVVIGFLCVGLKAAPAVNHTLRIAELLQPVLNAQNKTMSISASAEIGGKAVALESDIFLVEEDGVSYLAVEQNGTAVYIAENVLFLENGKAFKLGEKMQSSAESYETLLPQIGILYEVLNITAMETEEETVYSITVTGEQVDRLLAVFSLGEELPVEGIGELKLQLTEKKETLEAIDFSGSGVVDGTDIQLHVTVSGFRMLAAGDDPIPEAVKQSAATVNPEELFSLTEDLYRLVLALMPLTDMDSIDGTLELTADCGPLQLNTRMTLANLKNASSSQVNPEALQALPKVLGFMCLEGDIRCTHDGDAYRYTLELDRQAMQELTRQILPELIQYSMDLTEGRVTIVLQNREITSMGVSVKGKIRALVVQIPMEVGAVFTFS